MSTSGNYYDKVYESEAFGIEQAILAEDVTFTTVKDIEGKFFIKVLTPMLESQNATTKNSNGIISSNYITLTIPSYILYKFMNITPTTINIDVPTLISLETGKPIKYKNYKYSVLSYSYSNTASSNSSSVIKSSTKTKPATNSFVIPKGTVFFAEFLAGQADADKTYIIGVSPFRYVE